MMLNANFYQLLLGYYKNIIVLFLGNHISPNFAIHIDKHNYYV